MTVNLNFPGPVVVDITGRGRTLRVDAITGMTWSQAQGFLDQNGQLVAEAQTAVADAQQVAADSRALVDDYGNLVTRAENAEAAAYNVPDTAMRDIINNPATETRGALDDGYARREVHHAETYKTGARTDLEALHAACAAATAAGRGNIVHLSSRTWDVGAGFSMSGYSCGIVGTVAGHNGTNATGAVLYASTQDGPVLNLTGIVAPASMRGRLPFRNFAIRGSGVADPTRANIGFGNTSGSFASVVFSDIAVSDTGGPCVDLTQSYLSHYERLTLMMPVGAQANDVPWFVTRATRGNRFYSIGFRSLVIGGSVGPSGALVTTSYGAQVCGGDLWHGAWFEALHAPTDGTLIHVEGNGQVFADTYFVDCGAEELSTNTSLVRIAPSGSGSNFPGGNIWRGAVPGRNAVSPEAVTTGILVEENNVHVEGPKELRGSNVTLAAGVTGAFVALGGSQAVTSGSPTPSVVDNSGNTENTYLDYAAGTFTLRGYRVEQYANGPRFTESANPANGRVWLGDGGSQILAANGGLTFDGNSVRFRNGSTLIGFDMGTRPGINMPNAGPTPLPAASSSLRGRLIFVQGGAGEADQTYICRKRADGAYEWAPLA